jgi:hypothetical protein
MPGPRKRPSDGLCASPRRRIDDGHCIVAPEQRQQSVQPLFLALDLHCSEPEIATVERAQVGGVVWAEAKRTGNLLPNAWRCAPRESHRLRLAEPVTGSGQPPVTRPEVVPPFGDAVSLVDDQEPRADPFRHELLTEPFEPLRRYVQHF